jgi:hypothetical protein
MKSSVVFTPHGTEIFIPGYISFDPKRDQKLGVVSRLHRARGIRQQGLAALQSDSNASDCFSIRTRRRQEMNTVKS